MALGKPGVRNRAAKIIDQQATLSPLCRLNSGFWITASTEVQRAAARMNNTPASNLKDSLSLTATSVTPAKERAVPSQATFPNFSPSSIIAQIAVRIGLTL